MSATCRLVRILAPSASDGAVASRLDDHIGSCLACQAELARYGKLRRQLAAMADDAFRAPESLAAAVAAAIEFDREPVAGPSTSPARLIAAAGAVTAAAAGAVAVAVWRHSRPVVR